MSATESGQALRRANRQETEVAGLVAELDALRHQLQQQQEQAQSATEELQAQLQQQRQQARVEVEKLQQQLEVARHEVRGRDAAVADEQIRGRELELTCSRQMHELELRVQEAIRQAQSADRECQRLETAVATAEVRRPAGADMAGRGEQVAVAARKGAADAYQCRRVDRWKREKGLRQQWLNLINATLGPKDCCVAGL